MATKQLLAWREPEFTKLERRRRTMLRKAIHLAQRFEGAYRPRRTNRPGDREILCYVGYAHLVRAIQVCQGILLLGKNPAHYALLRVLAELFINLQFIESDATKAADRARNFHDFYEVNRYRLLLEIARRFPHHKALVNVPATEAKLAALEPRFKHGKSWDWDTHNLVDR